MTASHEIGVNGQWTTDGRTAGQRHAFAANCWRRRNKNSNRSSTSCLVRAVGNKPCVDLSVIECRIISSVSFDRLSPRRQQCHKRRLARRRLQQTQTMAHLGSRIGEDFFLSPALLSIHSFLILSRFPQLFPSLSLSSFLPLPADIQ